LAVNEAWKGKSQLNPYADLVMETDAIVGRILETLEATGKAKDTIVIVTSDNGCAAYIGVKQLEEKGHFPSGPLKGYKASPWEGGHRIPLIVRWPGTVAAKSVCDHLVHHADVMATLAEILGVKLPDEVGEDSVSMLPLWQGKKGPTRDHAVSQSSEGVISLRDGSWSLIAQLDKDGEPQLFNLADDLGQTKNLSKQKPKQVETMLANMEQWVTDGRSTPGVKQKNDVPVVWRRFLDEKRELK
jgi:arylsulfatase A-like enzyme